ncbi:MAG: precorrin-6y C5,15-methyltransferase (decarboxylating) subunit CbiE [Thermoplasmata archaeon]|jgi:cobalt-precorrin-7 (C5)-methyltransferase
MKNGKTIMAKVYIIGVGPGNSKYLTEISKEIISKSDIVLGWDLDLYPVMDIIKGKEIHLQNLNNYIEKAIEVANKYKNTEKTVVILRIGDPCISSGLDRLLKIFDDFEIEIIPGISSVQLAASLANINIDESVIISFHDGGEIEKKKEFMLKSFRDFFRNIIMLVGPEFLPHNAAEYLISNGIDEKIEAIVFEKLSFPDQKVIKTTLEKLTKLDQFYWLSVLVIINPKYKERYNNE